MRVKVHPHRTRVNSGITKCVSVTPDEKGGRAYYKGTVLLRDASFRIYESGVKRAQAEQVRNVHAWCVGTMVHDSNDQIPVEPADGLTQVTYHFNIGRFITLDGTDVTDMTFDSAVCSGRNFYVSL